MPSQGSFNILDLNDDCIYHMYQFLSIVDWCSLRDTCTHFRTISDFCFDRRSKTFDLESVTLSGAKRVPRCYGKLMIKLSLNAAQGNFHRYELVPFINRYCRSLLDLELLNLNFNVADIEQSSRQLSNLHRLVLDTWCDEEAVTSCLAHCTSLKELESIRVTNITGNKLANCRLKSLESFNLSSCNINYGAVTSFLTLNRRLKRLKLFDEQFQNRYGCMILKDVVNVLPKLEAMSLHQNTSFRPNVLPVTRMTSLKKLEANLERVEEKIVNQVLKRLAVQKRIEDLHLKQFTCTVQSIGLLASLKSLKILKFTKTNLLNGRICKTLASELNGLDEIHIHECENTSLNDIKEFVVNIPTLRSVVFNRPKKRGLSIDQEMFFSLVEIRTSQETKGILLIFLDNDDLRRMKHDFKLTGMTDIVAGHGNVLKILPLDDFPTFNRKPYNIVHNTGRC